MILKIFVIFDSKAGAYLPPFFMHAEGQATRAFSNMANDRSTQIGLNPEDYTLFEVGTFDDNTAQFEMLESKRALGTAIEYCSTVQSEVAREISNEFVRASSDG